MLRIGLTGGIGAGKSAVAGRLAELGAVVVMAPVGTRLARLTAMRGMDEADAKSRIAIQATEEERVAPPTF